MIFYAFLKWFMPGMEDLCVSREIYERLREVMRVCSDL